MLYILQMALAVPSMRPDDGAWRLLSLPASVYWMCVPHSSGYCRRMVVIVTVYRDKIL
jgi:hypothetical protein